MPCIKIENLIYHDEILLSRLYLKCDAYIYIHIIKNINILIQV